MTHEAVKIHGTSISPGCAMGKLRFFVRDDVRREPDSRKSAPETEQLNFLSALERARRQLNEIFDNVLRNVGENEAGIFKAHLDLLDDDEFLSSVEGFILQGLSAPAAVLRAGQTVAGLITGSGDEEIEARAANLTDVSQRLCRILTGGLAGKVPESDEPYILAADYLSPGETVQLDRELLLGLITFGGTRISQTAVLARAMGLPALTGTGTIPRAYENEIVILDADAGTVTVSPDINELERYADGVSRHEAEEGRLAALIGRPTVTRGGKTVLITAEAGSPEEAASAFARDADGIGLMRTESLYLSSSDFPEEETQFQAYRQVLEAMHGKKVIFRTLDVGTDDKIDYFALPCERNPSLGFRGIRLSLARPDILRTQLRAILRASVYGKSAVMLPMAVSQDEFRRAKAIMIEVKNELRYECIPFDESIPLGIIIETPAAVMLSDVLSRETDFLYVGTNDLIQFTLAADRRNPALAGLIRDNTEPLLRSVGMVADAAHREGKTVGVCGELAGELSLTQRFLNLGVDEFTVPPPQILYLREKLLECE